MERYRTGVPGLDDLLMDGLVLPHSTGLIILIKGRPGSGKTTLALQMAIGAKKWTGLPETDRYYCTCEQEPDDIRDKINALSGSQNGSKGIDINPWLEPSTHTPNEQPFSSVTPTLQAVNDITRWLNAQNKKSAPKAGLLVVDGLNVLSDEEQSVAEMERLVAAMRRRCKVGIVVFGPMGDDYSNVDFQSDLVIELRSNETQGAEGYFLTHLSITKSRFQMSALGWHQYKIRTYASREGSIAKHGIEVFPSIHFRLTQHKTLRIRLEESKQAICEEKAQNDRCVINDGSFLDQILSYGSSDGNLKEGSCTVLLGPRRSWKTQITFNFLKQGSLQAKQGSLQAEPGLLVSLIDNQGRLVTPRECLCDKDCPLTGKDKYRHKRCMEHAFYLQMPPGCITADEFFSALEKRLSVEELEYDKELARLRKEGNTSAPPDMRIRRLVFWDLAQLEYRFPLLHDDPMFLPGLINYLKYSKIQTASSTEPAARPGNIDGRRHITSLFMGASNSSIAKAASAMADNVLFCWQDKKRINRRNGAGESNDVAIYVDRIEGKPGRNQLFFIDGDPNEPLRPDPILASELINAEAMIGAIQQLQGLAGLPQFYETSQPRVFPSPGIPPREVSSVTQAPDGPSRT